MGVEDEVGRYATTAAGKSRTKGTEIVPTRVLNLSQAGGVKAARETSKGRPTQNVGIVARKATQKVNARRSTPIRINPDPARLDKGADKNRTM